MSGGLRAPLGLSAPSAYDRPLLAELPCCSLRGWALPDRGAKPYIASETNSTPALTPKLFPLPLIGAGDVTLLAGELCTVRSRRALRQAARDDANSAVLALSAMGVPRVTVEL